MDIYDYLLYEVTVNSDTFYSTVVNDDGNGHDIL